MGLTKYGAVVANMYDPLLAKPLHSIRKRVALEARRLGVDSVIDLCCGTGHQLSYFDSSQFSKVLGIDLSPHMVKVAKKKYGVNCFVQDAAKTEFDDNTFDLSMVSFALHEKPFELAQQIVHEAKRITRPSGYFFVVDYVYDSKTAKSGKAVTWFIEFLAGGEHFRNFRKYLKLGGLPQLTKDLHLLKDIRFVSGSVALQIFKIEK